MKATGLSKWTAVAVTLALAGYASIHCSRGTTGVSSGGGQTRGSPDGGSRGRGGVPSAGGASNGGEGREFVSLAVVPGAPLDRSHATPVSPAPPPGWLWYEIAGAICRDKSPTGFYVRYTGSDKLLIFLEGGGACISPGFCNYNPASVNQVLGGGGQTAFGSLRGIIAGRQQPGCYSGGTLSGIFDSSNGTNPFKDWNMVYVPYCTGDVFFGTRTDVIIPGATTPQQFVGYRNMQKFMARIVPTFKDSIKRVILAGSSAGAYGASLNFSMVQDSFGGGISADLIVDSGPSFTDRFMPVCMQKRWRDLWGFADALPPDCTECFQADGGGLLRLSDFLLRKHPAAKVALVSSMQDEMIRLFYSAGNSDCANFEQAHPVRTFVFTLGDTFPADQYTAGLNDLRAMFTATHRLATYYLAGANITSHQHIARPRFFGATTGVSIALWMTDFLDGRMTQIGP